MTPACYGIVCEKHSECARYHAVDGAGPEQEFIGHCLEDGERVMFVMIETRETT